MVCVCVGGGGGGGGGRGEDLNMLYLILTLAFCFCSGSKHLIRMPVSKPLMNQHRKQITDKIYDESEMRIRQK